MRQTSFNRYKAYFPIQRNYIFETFISLEDIGLFSVERMRNPSDIFLILHTIV